MPSPLSVVYFGSAQFAVPPLEFLLAHPGRFSVLAVVTQPAKPVGRKGEVTPTPVADAARRAGLEPIEAPTLKDDVLYEKLKALAPDFFIVAAYGRIISKRYLDIPKFGPVNLHGSLLPKYRGASPIQSALLEGEAETGVSLMVMDAEVDHGGVIAMEPVAIASEDTYETLAAKLAPAGVKLLDEKLEPFARGEIKAIEQDHAAATFTTIIGKNDGLVDFTAQDAARIERKLRAYTPWPGVTYVWNRPDESSLRLKLLKLRVLAYGDGAPGMHSLSDDGYPAIVTKGGSIEILELQAEGKKPADGKGFLNGYRDFIAGVS